MSIDTASFNPADLLDRLFVGQLRQQLDLSLDNAPRGSQGNVYAATIAADGLPSPTPVAQTATAEAGWLADVMFTMTVPQIAPDAIDTIVAYSFGNRAGAAGGQSLPGPINEQIALSALRLQGALRHARRSGRGPTIYAQWEVAQILSATYGLQAPELVAVAAPTIAADGSVTVASVDSVTTAILALAPAASLGKVGVLTHRDQAKTCILNAASHGLTAATPATIPPVFSYDPQAAAVQYRRRDLFLMADMVSQFATLRADLIAAEYPAG